MSQSTCREDKASTDKQETLRTSVARNICKLSNCFPHRVFVITPTQPEVDGSLPGCLHPNPCWNCGWTMLSSSQNRVVPWNVLAFGYFLSLFENFSHRQHSLLVPKKKTVFSIVRRTSMSSFCIWSATKGEVSVGPMESSNFKLFSNGSQLGKVFSDLGVGIQQSLDSPG